MSTEQNKPISVTTLDSLKQYAQGTIVELPPFAEGKPFVAKLNRPSLMAMAASGKIPDILMAAATKMFFNRADDASVDLSEWYSVMEIFADACLVEPTYAQVKEAGISLTDEQLIAIFNYGQAGTKAIKALF